MVSSITGSFTYNALENVYVTDDTIEFIIPANKSDYPLYGADTLTHKMEVRVVLDRDGASPYISERKEISRTAQCNKILHLNLKAQPELEIDAELKDWNSVDVDGNIFG